VLQFDLADIEDAMDLKEYPLDDDDAAARAVLFGNNDPFPSIPRSLLSSAEIDDYARMTGMLSPYDPKQLKSASYEVHIGGEVIMWDEDGTKKKSIINKGDELILPANSIVFTQVKPIFRLPHYIAIRFNLRISHVQRGLLLGTGPLVDPGFQGKLLIPLHNLTAEPYSMNTNDALIWIEFTKTTFGCKLTEQMASTERVEVLFPEGKRWLTPEDYLRKANGPNPIRSSIPGAIRQAARSAEAAQQSINFIRRVGIVAALVTAAALAISLFGVWYQVGQMIQNAQALVSSVQQVVLPVAGDVKSAADKTAAAQSQIERLSQQVEVLSREMQAIKDSQASRAKKQ
jgi:deoxycytidine triphosphate deaminase